MSPSRRQFGGTGFDLAGTSNPPDANHPEQQGRFQKMELPRRRPSGKLVSFMQNQFVAADGGKHSSYQPG
jgi:hypothetical protein